MPILDLEEYIHKAKSVIIPKLFALAGTVPGPCQPSYTNLKLVSKERHGSFRQSLRDSFIL